MDDQQPATVPSEQAPEPIETPSPLPRRRTRWVAGITAATAVLALGGVGGYAVGERVHSPSSTASPQQDSANSLPFGGAPPSDGTQPDLGATGTDNGTTANASQTTGLVRIMTTLGYQDGEAAGTGMILTSDGEVVTNHHVVAGATSIKATVMSSGKTYNATVVGSDTKDDVAVLQLADASGLTRSPPTARFRVWAMP